MHTDAAFLPVLTAAAVGSTTAVPFRMKCRKLTAITMHTDCTNMLPSRLAQRLMDFGVGEQHFRAPSFERLP